MSKAIKFYDAIAERAAKNGHAIDIWGCALDQVGLHEMKNCVVGTGGYVIQAICQKYFIYMKIKPICFSSNL